MGRHALLVGVRDYEDDVLDSLPAVDADLHCLNQVLEEPDIGGFEVETVPNPIAGGMKAAIGEFLDARTADDVVLLYLSGHGIWSPDAGQLYFAARDTRRDGPSDTGVSAEYVRDTLEGCQARQKVLLLDCCYSGAFVQGFRARGAGARTDDERLLPEPAITSRGGVYVITASDQRQHAYEGLPIDGDVQPSLFTGAVVEGLRTGHADVKNNGVITPDDLWTYVSEQVRRQRGDQSPTKSTAWVVGSETVLAHSIAGRPLALRPLAPAEQQPGSAAARVPSGRDRDSTATAIRGDPNVWRRLLGYYRDCIAAEAANDTLLPIGRAGRERFALWTGAEEILVGDRVSVPVPARTDAEALVSRVHDAGGTLGYGYPAVLLFDRQGDGEGKLAPLFTRIVEPFRTDDGWHLRPVGAVMLHPGLIKRRLASDDANAALAGFEPGWSPGSHSQLGREAIRRLRELDLAPGALRPAELNSALDQHPRSGGRNAALLYEAHDSTSATRSLMKDLEDLRERTTGFAGTALDALARAPGSTDDRGASRFEVVCPFDLNEPQEAVLRSAMTMRLTVATGPPGTGKSQLVANVVATAVANGQRVLVTSTNNRAVDEVWERCNDLAPGLLLRTGSRGGDRDYEQAEIECLRDLQRARPPSGEPDWHTLRLRAADRDEARECCAHKARAEAELLALSTRRRETAGALELNLADLPAALAQDSTVEGLRRRAQSAARHPLLGGWRRRRRRLATLLGLPDAERETCSKAAAFLELEADWRRQRASADRLASDAALCDELRGAATKVRGPSQAIVTATVAAKIRDAQAGIAQRLRALQGDGNAWSAFNKMKGHFGAWAVTTHSARRLPPDAGWFDLVVVDEATQCSTAAALPTLYRAKRALVIGDPMQLTHITTCVPAQNGTSRREAGLEAAFLERFGLDYIRHSAFHAAAAAFGEPLMLDDHFRCHPEIIALPNRLFYGGRLTVLTDPQRLARAGMDARLRWADVAGSPDQSAGGSWYNREEVDEVRKEVARLRDLLPDEATIGVVTPFAAQKDRLARALAGTGARVGTVHTFQGGERDAIVLSLVGGTQMRKHTVSWLERSANLWNVAITRARAHLVVVGDRGFWLARAGIVGALARETAADRGSVQPADHRPDPAGDALHRVFERRFPDAFDRAAALDGYSCDFRIDLRPDGGAPAGSLAVVLDRGASGTDPARHLRLQFERCELLRKAAGVSAAARVPAWQALAEPDGAIDALAAGVENRGSSHPTGS